jgi:hypothetical protein
MAHLFYLYVHADAKLAAAPLPGRKVVLSLPCIYAWPACRSTAQAGPPYKNNFSRSHSKFRC